MSLPISHVHVVKFSHAVNENLDEKNIEWKHMTNNGMFLIIDDAQFSQTSQMYHGQSLRVMHGDSILEYLPLEDMCKTAKLYADDLKARGIDLPPTRRSIFAIVRSPCVALRYRRSDGKTRRIQVKFSNNEDYEKIVNILQILQCAMTSSALAPSTAPKGPSCPPSALDELSGRFTNPANSAVAHMSNDELILRSRPSTSSVISHSLQPVNGHEAQDSAKPHSFARPHTSASMLPKYPMHQPFMTHSTPYMYPTMDQNEQNPPRPDNMLQSPQHTYNATQQTNHAFQFQSSNTSRPATAPAPALASAPVPVPTYTLPSNISAVLPPRRELPFDNPENRRPLSCSHSRPTSAHRSASSTNHANNITTIAAAAAGAQESLTPSVSRSSRLSIVSLVDDDIDNNKDDSNDDSNIFQHQARLLQPSETQSHRKTLPLLHHHQLQKQTSTPMPATISQSLTSDTLSHGNLASLFNPVSTTTASQAGTETTSPNPNSRATTTTTTIQDLICSYLRDDNFLKLCEEVEGEWRRVTATTTTANTNGASGSEGF